MRILLVPLLWLALALPASADKLSLSAISSYLNTLRTAEAEFTQINDDGTISTGRILIKRPGRIRFEYNPPEKSLVLASSNAVYVIDLKSNQPPATYPLGRTPLSIILADNVNLGRAKMVTGHKYDGKATTVVAQDPEHPEYGNIELKFTGPKPQLRQWIINSEGSRTTVILGDLKTGGAIKNSVFRVDPYLPKNDR